LVERLSLHHVPLTRIGHPARVLEKLVPFTLDAQSLRTSSSEVLLGIKKETESYLKEISNGKLRHRERREKWGEVRELRKEYRSREGGAVQEVLREAMVVLATCHGYVVEFPLKLRLTFIRTITGPPIGCWRTNHLLML
jgi:DNA polymerase alpha-associated DNA helicase A